MSVLLAVSGWTLPVVALPDGDDPPLPTQTASSTEPEDTQQSPPSASASAQPTASELNSASPLPSASADPSDKPAPSSSPSAPVSSQDATASQSPMPSADATASQSPTPSADALPIGAMTAEQIEAMIAELPTAEQIACADFGGDKQAVYDQMQAVFDALDLLAEGESIDPAAQEKLVALAEYFNQAMTLATITTVGSPNTQNYIKDKLIESSMTGPYRFNFAGNTNCSGKYNNTNVVGVPNHSNTTYEKNCGTLPANIGGQNATNTNSSSSTLTATTGTSGIAKAYLVVALTQYGGSVTSKTAPLGQYGFYMVGPKGEYRHFYPSTIYQDNVNTRVSAYFDVTAWVRGQGYGTYTAVNLPYTAMNGNTAADWNNFVDCFASWKLIIVEEDTNLPLRMVKLQLGGISVSPATPANVKIEGDGLVIKDNPTGELIFSLDGQDPDSAAGGTQQSLQYNTSKVTTYKSIYSSLRSTVHFFTGQILKDGSTSGLGLNPGNTRPYYDHGNGGQGTLPNVNGGKSFNYANHDLEIMAINDSKNTGGIKLNGKETFVSVRTDTTSAPTIQSFMNIQENHLVEVLFRDDKAPALDQLLVNTQIVNGPGTITPSQVIAPNSNVTIQWAPSSGYRVSKVVFTKGGVRQEVAVSENQLPLNNVDEDCLIQVYLESSDAPKAEDLFDIVTSLTGGPGAITPTERDILRGQERTVAWSVDPGYRVQSVVIDGVTRDDLLAAGSYTFSDIQQDHSLFVVVTSDQSPATDEEFVRVNTEAIGNGTISDSVRVHRGDHHRVTWEPAPGESVLRVEVDGVERPDLLTAGGVDFTDIQDHHQVSVTFSDTTHNPPPEPDELLRVDTDLYGGPGTITASCTVYPGEDQLVNWSTQAGYEVQAVIVNGQMRDDLIATGSVAFTDIQKNQHVVVILKDAPEEPQKPQTILLISTEQHGQGSITPSTTVSRGSDHVVTWVPADGWHIEKVYVDGLLQSDAVAQSGQMNFVDIVRNHHVEVFFAADDDPDNPNPPDDPDNPNPPDDPDAVEPFTVSTMISGGLGSITPTRHYPAGADALVSWQIDPRYDVARIYVDGELHNELIDDAKTGFISLDRDHDVQIILIPLRPIDTQLVKSAFNLTHRDGPNVVGDAVRYSLSVQNHTPDSQWDQVVLCDQLPLSLTLLPDSLTLYGPEPVGRPLDEGEYTFDEKTGKLTVPVGTIRGGETYTLVFDAVINSKAVSPTGGVSIQNLAVASGTDADGVPLPDVWSDAVIPGVDPGDPDPGVQPLGPDGYVDKSAVLAEDAERLEVGQRIVYDIAVGNRLDGSMWADVRVRDLLPAGLTPDLDTLVVIDPQGRSIQPQRDAYALTAGMLTVCIGDIYGGEVYHIRFEAVINAQALESGIGNRAVAGGYTPDGKPTDPSAPDDPMPDGEGAIVIELPDPVYPAGFGPDDPIKGIAPVDTTPQPHTGDAFLSWLAGGICLAAAIALLVLLLTRKKRNKQTS
jgi:uncharacterized repeat protein (TIGR01451 family)/fimbrial isopeptide formation D2 family protein